MITVEICERANDFYHLAKRDESGKIIGEEIMPKFHAQIKYRPGIWGQGLMPSLALGDMIYSNPGTFGISLEMLGKLPR